jgi:hypothetical protein
MQRPITLNSIQSQKYLIDSIEFFSNCIDFVCNFLKCLSFQSNLSFTLRNL